MILEVIATCMEDALIAEASGADRIELITAITEGGLTPGIGMVEQVSRAVQIPVHVMIRPHSRTFVYNQLDLDTMTAEIQAVAATGAAGIVIGALTADGEIDEPALIELLAVAGGLQVTFHRAFDELSDQLAGLQTLNRYSQVTRVLTSGGVKPALQAIGEIRALVDSAKGSGIRILAGHGLTPDGISSFVQQTGVEEVHFGSAVRIGQNGLAPIDPERLRALAHTLHTGSPCP